MLAAAAAAATALPARADPIAGAAYAGRAADGAAVSFTVSADGTLVNSYRITNVPGDTCLFIAEGDNGVWDGAPILSGGFQYRLYDAILFRGTFPGTQSAAGTFRLYNHTTGATKACDTGTVSWTATTLATPPPPKTSGGGRTFATRVTLRKASRKQLAGRLGSTATNCRAGRHVTLWRASRRIASTRSGAGGRFTFARSARVRAHRVRAIVAARTVRGTVCAAGSSKFISA